MTIRPPSKPDYERDSAVPQQRYAKTSEQELEPLFHCHRGALINQCNDAAMPGLAFLKSKGPRAQERPWHCCQIIRRIQPWAGLLLAGSATTNPKTTVSANGKNYAATYQQLNLSSPSRPLPAAISTLVGKSIHVPRISD